MLVSALLLCLGAAPAAPVTPPAAALQDTGAPGDVRALLARSMQVVRDRRLSLDRKGAAFEALLGLADVGPRALAAHLERDLAARAKRRDKETAALLEGVERRAQRVLDARLTRALRARIDADRTELLALARDPGLTKGAIGARSDPALARLSDALTVTTAQVWDADEELFEDYVALLDAHAEDAQLYAYWARCRAALEALEARQLLKRLRPPADPRGADDALVAALRARAAAATPMTDADRRVLAANAALEGLDGEERAGVAFLNRTRVLLGLNALALDLRLGDASRDHSLDMVRLGFFSHDSPVAGKETPWRRAANFGTSAGAENIAAGATTGKAVIEQWWYSPGHHRNMLGGARRVGLGRHEQTWTQMFGG
jgi:uncharacterized protein YkwD